MPSRFTPSRSRPTAKALRPAAKTTGSGSGTPTTTAKSIREIGGFGGTVFKLRYSPDGKNLLAAGADKTVHGLRRQGLAAPQAAGTQRLDLRPGDLARQQDRRLGKLGRRGPALEPGRRQAAANHHRRAGLQAGRRSSRGEVSRPPTGGQITVQSGVTSASGGALEGTTVFTIAKGGKRSRQPEHASATLTRKLDKLGKIDTIHSTRIDERADEFRRVPTRTAWAHARDGRATDCPSIGVGTGCEMGAGMRDDCK